MPAAICFCHVHKEVRRMFQWSGFKGTYAEAFKIAVAFIDYAEQQAAEEAAYLASLPPVPEEVQERARELRAMSEACPVTRAGNEMFTRLSGEARALIDAARGIA